MKELLNNFQKGIYYNELLHPNSSINNIGGYIELWGQIDRYKVQQAIQTLINSQTALRIIICQDADSVYQKVKDSVVFHLQEKQVSKASVQDYIEGLFCIPFKLFGQPLYHFELLQVEKSHFFLIVKLHHLIADGWSMQLIADSINSFYLNHGDEGKIFDYLDFNIECGTYSGSKRFTLDDIFWENKLKEIKVVSRPSEHNSIRAKRKSYYFEADLSDAIYRYIKEKNMPVNQFFVSVWGILLNYMNGENKQYIGMPIYNRRNTASKRTVGMYTNIVPLVLEVDVDQTIEQYMYKIKNSIYNSMKHSMYPFSNILDKVKGVKSEYTYQYVFNYFNMKFTDSCCGCKARVVNVFPDTQTYSLQLSLYEWDKERGIGVSFDYAEDSFDEAQIDYYYSLLVRICSFMMQNTATQISTFDFMSGADKKDLEKFNSNFFDNGNKDIFSIFKEQVNLFSEKTAVCDGEKKYSYSEFYVLVNRYVVCLHGMNVAEGDFVCIHVDHSVNTLALIWAIVYVGGIFVPIEKKWPENKKSIIFEQTNAKIIFIDDEYGYKDFYCANIFECIREDQKHVIVERSKGKKPLYLIYTSGTTGKPKGVLVSNESLHNYLIWAKEEYKISSSDVMPLFSSISFDFTLTTMFLPLISGATVVIYNASTVVHPIFRILEENISTVLKVTPSHLNIIAAAKVVQSNIRAVIIGGEKLYTETIRNTAKVLGDKIDFFNEYGPTETTIGCMTYLCNQNELRKSIPIGSPINNTEVYLLDHMLKPVGKYKWAEMYIAGKGLAYGYYNDCEQTEKAFVTSDYLGTKRLYKTGDIARFNAKGIMEYLGRNDGQIKVHGYRIELDEIYSAIMKVENINDCAIEAVKESGSEYLVAYLVVNEQDTEAFTLELKRSLSEQLVQYMIPSQFIYVDTIPLTINGKVDIVKLRKNREGIEVFDGQNIKSYEDSNEENRILLFEIKRIFNKENISISSNFIEIGGDSIKAIILAQKLYQKGYNIKIQDIMLSLSLKEISGMMKKNKADKTIKALGDKVELTSIVYRFIKSQDTYSNDSNHEVTIQLQDKIEETDFVNTLKLVIGNHPALMLNVSQHNEYLVYNQESIKEFGLRSYKEQEKVCFDLHKDLLFVVQKTDFKTYKIIINHLVVDFISWQIILNEIDYLLSSVNTIKQLMPERLLYEEYAASNLYNENTLLFKKQRGHITRSKFIKQIDLQKHTAQVQKVKAKYGLSVDKFFMYLLGYNFNILYGKDVIFELESHGRDEFQRKEELSNVVGWFTKVEYLRCACNKENSGFVKYCSFNLENAKEVGQEDFLKTDVVRYNFLGDFKAHYSNFKVLDPFVAYKFEDKTDYLYEFDLQLNQEKELIIYASFEEGSEQEEQVGFFFQKYVDLIDELLSFQISEKVMEIQYIDDDISLDDIENLIDERKFLL